MGLRVDKVLLKMLIKACIQHLFTKCIDCPFYMLDITNIVLSRS